MSIMLPPALAKLFGFVTGMKWPEANEDRLRTAGDDYLEIYKKVPELRSYLLELVNYVKDEFEGEAADRFVQEMGQLIGADGGTDYVTASGDSAKELGDYAHKTANQVEYAKWMIIAQLVQLAAQIAWAIANIPLTFGASLATIFAAEVATRELVKQVFIWLFKQIALHEFLNITTSMIMDGIIQGIQIGQGHKDHWEKDSFLQAIEFGAINGLLTGPLELLTFGFGKLFGKVFGGGIGKELQNNLKNLAGAELKTAAELAKGAGHSLESAGLNTLKKTGEGGLAGLGKTGVKDGLKGAAKTTAKDAVEGATKTTAKGAAEGAAKAGAKAGAKDAAEGAAKAGAKAGAKDAAEGAAKAGAKAGAKDAAEGAAKAGAKDAAEDAVKAAEKKLSNVEKFTQEMGKSFEEQLGSLGISKDLANEAGRKVAETIAGSGARYAVDLGTVRKLLDAAVKDAGKGGEHQAVKDLADRTLHLMDGLRPQTALQMLYKFGEGIGGYLKGGVQNILTEGTYNSIFGDGSFSVTAETFFAGVAMGAIGHAGHTLTGPARLRFQDKIRAWDAESSMTSDGKYYGLGHPRTLLAIASTLMGHPTSLLIPRPEGPKAREARLAAEGNFEHATRPKDFHTSSEGSRSQSSTTGERPTKDAPVKTEAKAPGETSNKPEPPAKVPTSGGGSHEQGPKPTGEPPAHQPVPAHATTSEPTPPAHVPVTGGHEQQGSREQQNPHEQQSTRENENTREQQKTSEQQSTRENENTREQQKTSEQQSTRENQNTRENGNTREQRNSHEQQETRENQNSREQQNSREHEHTHARNEELQYLDIDDSNIPKEHGHHLPSAGPERQPGWVLGDRPSQETLKALERLPLDPSRFAVVIHTNEHGLPMHEGHELSAEKLAAVVRGLAQTGHLGGDRRTIEFVACDLNGPLNARYVQEVMEHIWADPKLADVKAVAADGPVWVVPGFDSPTAMKEGPGTGHVVVAAKVGFGADGRPVVESGGNWYEYVNPASEEGKARIEAGEPLVRSYPSPLPEHYTSGPKRTDMAEASVFGDAAKSAQEHERSAPGQEPPPAYHYTDAPEHVRAEEGGRRGEQWRQAQRDLQDAYDAKLAEAADKLRQDPDGSGHVHDAQAEELLREAFTEGPVRFPDDAPPGLPTAVWKRAKDLMYQELTARPQDREQILAGLDGITHLAAVREAAVRVAMERFDRTVTEWSAPPSALGDGTATVSHADLPGVTRDLIRSEARGGFSARAEAEVVRIYARPEDLTGAGNAQAQHALNRLTEHLRGELDFRADHETALAQAEHLVKRATADWYGRLSPADRELLAAAGVTERPELSPDSVTLIREQLRDRLGTDFEEVAGPVDTAAGPRRERTQAVDLFGLALAGRAQGLPHEFAVQAAREAVIRRAATEAEKATESWNTDAGAERKDRAAAFGVTEHDVQQARGTVTRELAKAADRLVADHLNRGTKDTEALGRELDELTGTGAVHDRLTHQAARLAARRAAEEAAEKAAQEHGGLTGHGIGRLKEGHRDRITSAFDQVFGKPEDLKVRQEDWDARHRELTEELVEHAAFEAEAAPALRDAAAGFEDRAAPHVLTDDVIAFLKREYGDEFFARYRELWKLAHLDAAGWRAHQRGHEDAFARRREEEAAAAEEQLALVRTTARPDTPEGAGDRTDSHERPRQDDLPESIETALTGATTRTDRTDRTEEQPAPPPRTETPSDLTLRPRPDDEAVVHEPDQTVVVHESVESLVPAPRMVVDRTPRFVVHSSFEARRFDHEGPVTDLTVRIDFVEGGRGHNTALVWDKVVQGVEEYLNAPGYRLANGDRMHVTVLPARSGEQAHLTVDLVPRSREMDQKSWWLDADPIDYAHELGHQLGLRDEYRTAGLPHRPAVEGSLFGDHRAPAPDGMRQGGLRERHLQLISSVVGHLDPAPTHGRTWDEARELASPHDREHVWVDPVSAPHGTGSHEGGPLDVSPRANTHEDNLPPEHRRLVKQPGYSSGDQFGISAALLNDPNLHVLIARGPRTAEGHAVNPKDKSLEIEAFYRSIGIDGDRIHTVEVPTMETGRLYEVMDAEARRIVAEDWEVLSEQDQEAAVKSVTFGTDKVAKVFSDDLRQTVRDAWKMTPAHDQGIADWLTGRGITLPAPGSKVLVLWSRFTGKATQWAELGGRMEHDTSFQGVRQILREVAREQGMVLITGDPHPSRQNKWNELVAEMRAELGIKTIHHVTGFWKDGGPDPSVWTENLRTGQLRLYDFLDRHYDMNHLGTRSGNLEAAALLGHNVTYLEEKGSSGRERMEKWHANDAGETRLGGKAPGYERVVIPTPPTASGRFTVPFDQKHGGRLAAGERDNGLAPVGKGKGKGFQPPGMVDLGFQSPGGTVLWRKPAAVYGKERGFGYDVLGNIRNQLGLSSDRALDAGQFAADRVQHLQRRYEKLRREVVKHWSGEGTPEKYLHRFDEEFVDGGKDADNAPWQVYRRMVKAGLPLLPELWSRYRELRDGADLSQLGYQIHEVPRDGDCLYHSVNHQLGTAVSPQAVTTLRNRVTRWIGQNRELVEAFAAMYGARPDDLGWMVKTRGWWAGSNGDLIPSIVASALGVRLHIFDGVSWHSLAPVPGAPEGTRDVSVFLSESHYSPLSPVPAPEEAPVASSTQEGDGVPKRPLEHNSDSEPEDSAEKRLRPAPSGVSEESVVVNPLAVEHGGGMPVPGPLHERVQALEHLGPEVRRELAADTVFVEGLRSELSAEDFAQAAARLVIDVDPRVHQPVASRREAELQLARMLQDKEVAARLVAAGVRVVVVPRDVPLTGVAGFERLRGLVAGGEAGGGRSVDQLRGANDGLVVAIPEENLLGERTTVGPHPTQPEGYSSATHELAHAVLEFGMSREQRALVEEAYRGKRLADGLADVFGEESVTAWPDGSRRNGSGELVGNYSSADVHEFFAQLSNTYLGTNHGNDPQTGKPRNNGSDWVRRNEPELLPLLEQLYGPDPQAVQARPSNQVGRARAEETMYQGFREFMDGRAEGQHTVSHVESMPQESVVVHESVESPVSAPRMVVDRTPRFVVQSSFEARRFDHEGPVTDLTVRIDFVEGGRGHNTALVWDKVVQGVEEYLNAPGYRLANGDRMHVTVLPARPGERAHLTVDLVSRGREMDQRSWWLDADPIDYAHELGHQIGLRDEYRASGLAHRPAVEGSLLGDHRAPAPEGLRQGGLRERHLQLISSVVGHLDALTGGGSHGRTWDEAWSLATVHDREHVWVDPVSAPLGIGSHEGGSLDVAPRANIHEDNLPVEHKRLIKQPGYSSGDQFGISVALLNDPNLHVLIARGPRTAEGHAVNPKDKSQEIEAFYRSIGIPDDRIHTVDVPSMETSHLYAVMDAEARRIVAEDWEVLSEQDQEAVVKSVTFGTDKVAKVFSDTLRETVRDAWKMDPARDQQVAGWLGDRGITLPAEGAKVLVLWSRFTGKVTQWADLGGRMEHDTSFQGVRQILREVAREQGMVLITGDPHPSRQNKWNELVAEMRAELKIDTIHHITGFWKDGGPDPSVWTENLRTGQLRLYDFLDRHYDMNHLGTRSGNLEAAALLGHKVTYLEEKGSSGRERMEKWHEQDAGKTKAGGMAPGYERVVIPTPPTASGRFTVPFDQKHGGRLAAGERDNGLAPVGKGNGHQPPGMVDHGFQSPGGTVLWRKPAAVYGKERGFGFEALAKIREQLGLSGDRPLDAGQFAADRAQHLQNRYDKLRGDIVTYSGGGPEVEKYLDTFDEVFHADRPRYAGSAPWQVYRRMAEEGLPLLPELWTYHRSLRDRSDLYQLGYQIHEVPRDGDCLYHSVNHQLGTAVSPQAVTTLRNRVTRWISQNRELVTAFATERGSTFGDLAWMAKTRGWWAGSNGDLIPSIVASALGVRLHIFDGVNWHSLAPVPGVPEGTRDVSVFLSESHYSPLAPVNVPEGAQAAGSTQEGDGGQKRQLEHNSDSEPEDSAGKKLRPAPSGVSEESVVVNPLAVEHGGGMPVPGPLHERVQALEHLGPEVRRELAADMVFVEGLRSELSAEDFAQAAARLVIDVDPRVHQPVASRREAELQLARMLQDKEVAARLVAAGVRVVVVPRDVPLTGVAGFERLRGLVADGEAGGGRSVEWLRGANDELVVAIPEENLLGERTTVGPHPTQPEGYSSATHELAHAVLEFGLSREQRALVEEAYQGKRLADGLADVFGEESVTAWPDGSRRNAAGELVGNYSSADVHEFFAQLSNTYLGTNHGSDPQTGKPRNNGSDWVRRNEPELLPLLEQLYGPDPQAVQARPSNQVGRARAEETMYQGFQEFMEARAEEHREEEMYQGLREFMDGRSEEQRVEEMYQGFQEFMEARTEEQHVEELFQGFREFMDGRSEEQRVEEMYEGFQEFMAGRSEEQRVEEMYQGFQEFMDGTVEPPADPRPPSRVGERGLAAYDVLVALNHDDVRILNQLTDRFAEALHGDRDAARTLANSLFGGEVLRPMVSELSRGDVREVSFQAGPWSGQVRITGSAREGTYVRTVSGFEFEYGSEQQSTIGVTSDGLTQANLGVQFKAKFGSSGDLTETLGYQHGWLHGSATAEASRTLARGKTVEPAALFDTPFNVRVEFLDARLQGVSGPWKVPQPIDLGFTGRVAVPARETANAPQVPQAHYTVPRETAENLRLAGSHIVTDVWPVDRPPAPVPDAEGNIELAAVNQPVTPVADGAAALARFVSGFEGQAERYFEGRWPALKRRLLEELDLGTLHQELKGVMSGQKLTIVDDSLTGPAAVLTIGGGTVSRMQQVHTLPTTELNIATATTRSHVEQKTGSKDWQTLPSSVGNWAAKNGGAGVGVGGRAGRDDVELHGSGDDLGLGTKVKNPAVLFEGTADLVVTFGWRSRLSQPADQDAHVALGFRTVIDQAEAVLVTPVEEVVLGTQPPVFTAAQQLAPPEHARAVGDMVLAPRDEFWRGLPDTTTVRDLRSVAPLHAALDRIGREVFGGDQGWSAVREDVLQAYSHAAVSAHLVGMSRGSELRGPEVTLGPLTKMHVAVTARVTRIDHVRAQRNAELNPIRESTTFDSSRHLRSDTMTVQGQGGGKGPVHTRDVLDSAGKPFKDSMQGNVTASVESRVRDGWRGGESSKSYANGKYGSAQELFRTEITLDLTVNGEHRGSVPLSAELSLEQLHTALRQVGEQERNGFTGPSAPHQEVAEQATTQRTVTRLGQSDVVLSLGRGDTAVLRQIRETLERQSGHPVPERVLARLAREVDPYGLKAALSRLSRGERIRIPVDLDGWKGTVVVAAELINPRPREALVTGFEFEVGSQQRTTTGTTSDLRTRFRFRLKLGGSVPHVDLAGEASHTRDFVKGLSIDRTGGTNSRAKATEPARLSDSTAEFTVSFEPSKRSARLDDLTVPVPAVVAAPHRTLDPAAPARQLPSHRLGSSDVVTAVYRELGPDGTVREGTAHEVVQALGRTAAGFLGKDWPGMERKLVAKLDFGRLHTDLKSVMAGHPIEVKHGRSRAWITAEVRELTPTNSAPVTVEFNIGHGAQTSLTSSDGGTNTGGGQGNAITGSLLATTDVLATGAALVGGGSLTGAWGADRLEHGSAGAASGTAVKSKVTDGRSYRAEVVLKVEFERKPAVSLASPHKIRPSREAREQMFRRQDRERQEAGGSAAPSKFQTLNRELVRTGDRLARVGLYRRTVVETRIYADVLLESGRGEPVRPPRPDDPNRQLPPIPPAVPSATQVVRRPPESVFTNGLHDTGIVRWLDDTSGVRDLLTVFGERFFREGTWSWLESVARNTHSHAQLSALFGSVARGREILAPSEEHPNAPRRDAVVQDGRTIDTPSAGKRLFVDDAGISATISIVQLEYHSDNQAAAFSPANDVTSGGRHTRLDWRRWNAQGQLGAKFGTKGAAEFTVGVVGGGGHRWREGPSAGSSGKTVANAKIPTPAARYVGQAEVQLTFRDGDRTETVKGLVPIEMEIPISETTVAQSVSNHRVLYSVLHPEGQTISRGSTSDAVAEALATPLPGTDNQVHLLADLNERDQAGSREVMRALARLPRDPNYFTVAYHSRRPDGAPTWLGRELSPEEMAGALLRLAEGGQWQGEPLRFLSCNSGYRPHVPGTGAEHQLSFADRTLLALHEALAARRAFAAANNLPLSPALELLGRPEAFAAGGLLHLTGGDQPRMVVAQRVGYTAGGLPRVEGSGNWYHLAVTEHGTVQSTARGQELLRPDEEPVPQATEQEPIDPDQPVPVVLGDSEQAAAGYSSDDSDSVYSVLMTFDVTVPLPVAETPAAPRPPAEWSVQRTRALELIQPPKRDRIEGEVYGPTDGGGAPGSRRLERLAYDYGTGEAARTALERRLRDTATVATVAVTRPGGSAEAWTVRRNTAEEGGGLRWEPREAQQNAEQSASTPVPTITPDTHLWVTASGDHLTLDEVKRLPDTTYYIRAENSGDMYHMRAAMVAYPDRDLLIWNVTEATKTQVEQIINLHDDLIASGRRVMYTTASRLSGWAGRNETSATMDLAKYLMRDFVPGHVALAERVAPRAERSREANRQINELTEKLEVVQSTVRDYQDPADEHTLAAARVSDFAAGYGHYTQEEGEAFRRDLESPEYGGFGPAPADRGEGPKHLFVVYRASGHSGRAGANAPALDTGTRGVVQIIEQARAALGPDVVIVPMGEEPAHVDGPALREYWNWPSVGNRRKELALLKHLADTYNVAGAVGMRSGVMDELSFAGIKILSIDISLHRNGPGQLPNIKQSKGWTRGLLLENASGRNYGRAFVTWPRGRDTEMSGDFQGEFHARDEAVIRSAIEFYFGEHDGPRGIRHASHPHQLESVQAALAGMKSLEQMTGFEMARRTMPYLRELGEFQEKLDPAVWELVEERLTAAEERVDQVESEAADACAEEVPRFLELELRALGITWAADNERAILEGEPLAVMTPNQESALRNSLTAVRTGLAEALAEQMVKDRNPDITSRKTIKQMRGRLIAEARAVVDGLNDLELRRIYQICRERYVPTPAEDDEAPTE
ncbi:hypothetical protein [Kitasatospora sp. NPDC098663]|uniref:WXG100-like domain-containing protein n=1 Tax=Kitasatospora sp. NPDC098663 TaxID=3364096 RepID=UPI00382FE4F9